MNEDMISKLKEISTKVKEKDFSPFYYFYGEESHFLLSLKNSIIKSFDDTTGLNVKIYDKDNFNELEVIRFLSSFPVMSDKKLIIFDNVEYFKKSKEDNNTKKMTEAFLENKDLNIILVIKNENEARYAMSYKKDNYFFSFFTDNGVVLDLKKLDDIAISSYIAKRLKKANKNIDKVNLAYFIRKCGNDLTMLYNETDKLIAYLGDKESVDKVDIDNICIRNIDDSVYKLIDLFNSNKQDEALKFFGNLIEDNVKVDEIFNKFAYNFSNLVVCKDYMNRGKGQAEIAKLMGMESWRVANLMKANSSVSIDTLNRRMKKITELMLGRIKGNINENMMIELLMS